ncbi:hypothetical protein V9T40_005334 [Parthenolecanium corni]|uniref:Uncharacterized protein n=1 Tax=Parthenolecanium corni TaxID=536013 RepID=A0AAN9TH62_9HEMI
MTGVLNEVIRSLPAPTPQMIITKLYNRLFSHKNLHEHFTALGREKRAALDQVALDEDGKQAALDKVALDEDASGQVSKPKRRKIGKAANEKLKIDNSATAKSATPESTAAKSANVESADVESANAESEAAKSANVETTPTNCHADNVEEIEVECSSKMTVEDKIVNGNDADMKELPNKLMASGDEGDIESD